MRSIIQDGSDDWPPTIRHKGGPLAGIRHEGYHEVVESL